MLLKGFLLLEGTEVVLLSWDSCSKGLIRVGFSCVCSFWNLSDVCLDAGVIMRSY